MSPRQPSSITLLQYSGLDGGYYPTGPDDAMPTFVSHNDVVLNYMERGEMQVLMATGYRYTLGAGRLVVFWGAIPHKVEVYKPDSMLHWLVLPLGTFLRWPVSAAFTRQLIRGRVFFETREQEGQPDLTLLKRWQGAIFSKDAEAKAIVLLELEGRLRRLAHSSAASQALPRITPRGPSSQAERMLLLIAEHFREHLTGSDVATAVGLHRGYASSLFKRHVGMGLNEYITECRIAHAKALLATSDSTVLEVARDSGFGSVSQFHAVFQKLCGCTPRAFRKNLRQGKA